jgi:predicted nucleic acid-binding protein
VIYFDTSYLVRLFLEDPGWQKVRALAATDRLACCLHGRAEIIAAFHRRFRDGAITQPDLHQLIGQFEQDCEAGAFHWLPLSSAVIARLTKVYSGLPKNPPLRAADAIHLASAAENSFKEIYSNDIHQLAAATHFHLRGTNVI